MREGDSRWASATLPAPSGSGRRAVGEVVGGRYRLEAPIGRGGMSEVWRARDERLRRPVAVKLLPAASPDAGFARRLEAEATTVAGLRHPSIVAIHDFGYDAEDRPYLVMELLEGQPLSDVIGDGLGAATAVDTLLPIGRALGYAHAQGVVHRDLKPANVFLAAEAEGAVAAKLLDFGVARRIAGDPRLTAGWVGTPDFMAPEQLDLGREVGPAADQWAFSVLLYEAATGRAPFSRGALSELFAAIQSAPLPYSPALDGGLFRVLARGTRKRPEERYPSIEALLSELEAWASGGPRTTAVRPIATAQAASTPASAEPGPAEAVSPSLDDEFARAFGEER